MHLVTGTPNSSNGKRHFILKSVRVYQKTSICINDCTYLKCLPILDNATQARNANTCKTAAGCVPLETTTVPKPNHTRALFKPLPNDPNNSAKLPGRVSKNPNQFKTLEEKCLLFTNQCFIWQYQIPCSQRAHKTGHVLLNDSESQKICM